MLVNFLQRIRDALGPTPSEFNSDGTRLDLDDLERYAYAGQTSFDPFELSIYDGGKFLGGFGPTQVQQVDYWTLRARSSQLFNENLYARGIVRRLVTNEISTGLTPEASPDEQVLGMAEDSLQDWTDVIETRFALWGKTPQACDYLHASTFAALQRAARLEALVAGDVLVVLRVNPRTRLPYVQLLSGDSVRTPWGGKTNIRAGHEVKHGVEFDTVGREVAYHVQQADGTFKRLPAYGEKSGRRIAWLVFGTDKRLDDVRGQPLLALVLQSLKEIDRYRDSVQRKAVINSMLAMFIKKGEDKMGTLPATGGAVRRDSASVTDSTTQGTPRKFNMAAQIPGIVFEELQHGEEPVMRGGEGTDVNFGAFEDAVIQSVAWANEIPPEILRLAFRNNYTASQAAINEFKIYLNLFWARFGDEFCQPIYNEWLISEALLGKIRADGLLKAWRDPMQHDKLAAWTSCDWLGSIKPSTDMLKQIKGSTAAIEAGLSTRAREARITTGTKYNKNVKGLLRENQQLADAMRPLLEMRAEFGPQQTEAAIAALHDKIDEHYGDAHST